MKSPCLITPTKQSIETESLSETSPESHIAGKPKKPDWKTGRERVAASLAKRMKNDYNKEAPKYTDALVRATRNGLDLLHARWSLWSLQKRRKTLPFPFPNYMGKVFTEKGRLRVPS